MVYKSYSDLVTKHGESEATKLAEQKRYKQQTEGDAEPGFPWCMAHPDFPQSEQHMQFLVWDGASLQSADVDRNTVTLSGRVNVNGQATAALLRLDCIRSRFSV